MKFMCATWTMSVPLAMFVVLSYLGCLQTVHASNNMCGCASCTNDVLNEHANGYSCGSRIKYLMQELAFEEYDACARIGGTEFPIACRLCNPKTCDGRGNNDPTVGSSILVSRDNNNNNDNNNNKSPAYYCGCKACTADVWHAMATEYSCGARISYLTDVLKMASPDACTLVAGRQFSDYCGLCDPTRCEAEAINLSVEMPEEAATPTFDGKMTPVNVYSEEISNDQFVESKLADYMTLTARTSIYCFPDFLDRERYRNMWGRYTVEVKESDTLCGPGENRFSTKTVKRMDNDHLKLQFKKIEGQWHGSEVRVRLPESQMPLLYGNYSFSVKSVQVIDSSDNGTVIDTVLPPSLVLGLFTWDATEDYAIHENQNHEVDIELSRWNIPGDKDLQFLVQPPGHPQKARFYSGGGTSYQQAPRKFSFDWRPAEVEWYGDSGESHIYSTRTAVKAGLEDYVQCMPANVEVRMNLWNMFGTGQPSGMEDHHIVEVVIDDFRFDSSGITGLSEGEVCTKNCQCGPSSLCVSNACQSSRYLEEEDLTPETNHTGEMTSAPSLRSGKKGERTSFSTKIILGACLAISIVGVFWMQVYRPKWVYPDRPVLAPR